MIYQSAVIGAGPAGITAAIQLKRSGLNVLVFERKSVGGLALNANLVENYPGFPEGVKGKVLAGIFKKSINNLKIRIIKRRIKKIISVRKTFKIITDKEVFYSYTVIAASGTKPLLLNIPGEKKAFQSGRLFYEVKDIPSNNRNSVFTVIGGGEAAFDYSLNLAEKARIVNIVFRGDNPKTIPLLAKRVKQKPNIKIFKCHKPISIAFTQTKLSLIVNNNKKMTKLLSNYILVAIGRIPEIGYLPMNTKKTLGLFLAGDVKRGNFRQIGIAVGDGLLSAMQAIEYLKINKIC
jgi:thioredoxin reductase (NADPH)